MSMLVSGRAVSFCPWVALQNSRCMPTSTTTTENSSSLGHSCSGPTPICPAVTRACTATTLFLKAPKDLLAFGSTVMCVALLSRLCGCRQHYSSLHMCLPLYRVHLTIPSGSTVMWTITLRVLSNSLLHNNNRLSSVSGVVWLSQCFKRCPFLNYYMYASVLMSLLQAVTRSSRSGIVWENTCVATLKSGL